jgi:hypothetical protein
MKAWKDRFDQWVEGMCEALYDWFPSRHPLALAGNMVAGLSWDAPLPVDRRIGGPKAIESHAIEAAGGARTNASGWIEGQGIGDVKHVEDECGFWGYCHMLGYPCVRCGGFNSLPFGANARQARSGPDGKYLGCPTGSRLGGAWFGCCWWGIPAVPLVLGFYDCCTDPPQRRCGTGPFCQNWPDAKNWCFLTGAGTYRCTISLHLDQKC